MGGRRGDYNRFNAFFLSFFFLSLMEEVAESLAVEALALSSAGFLNPDGSPSDELSGITSVDRLLVALTGLAWISVIILACREKSS